MKIAFKFFIVLLLSFLSVFFNYDGLNVILALPLLAFFMYNGINSFILSLIGLILGSFTYYYLNNDYSNLVFLLIALCVYFLIYHISLIFNKKLIINYIISTIISIITSYVIYYISIDSILINSIVIIIFLSCFISLLFALLLKKFSFYLLSYSDEFSPVILFSLLTTYISLIINTYDNEIMLYISLFFILLISLIFSIKSSITNVLSYNSIIIILGYLLSIEILYQYVYLILISSVCLSINKSKQTHLNALLSFAIFVIIYFLSNNFIPVYYFIMTTILSIIVLLIKKKDSVLIENKYYVQYVKSKQEMLYQLQNFEKMFLTLSENFKKARQTRILTRAKEEVFDTLCFDCPNIMFCQKKGKHLLLNYVKDCLNNELDENKIAYIKHNCVKQEAYFKLLDKFTNTYLINSLKKEEDNKLKEIIASDFNSFASVMKQCSKTISNDKLLLANDFYKNLNEILYEYKFDVLFINNHSTNEKYYFDIAIKDIKKDEIENQLLPLIDKTLQTNMKISKIETTTLSSSYYIISIEEIEDIEIYYAIKQSNEDIKANGDSYSTLSLNKFFFLAISDGMGNGMDANEESRFTLDTLMSMLKTNMDVKTSINISNDIIQLKNDFESYTTLDLLAIDKKKKIVSFYKLGAFSTYIIRNHIVTEVTNYSLPLGIIDNIYISPSSYKIQKDDIIIMCSDGMIDDTNKSIINILQDISIDSPTVICNELFAHLIDVRQNSDDATLAVITIK